MGCTVRLSYKPALKGVKSTIFITERHCKNISIKSNDRLRGQVMPFLTNVSKSGEVVNEVSLNNKERRSVSTHLKRHCITLQKATNSKICHESKTYNRMTSLVSVAIGFLRQMWETLCSAMVKCLHKETHTILHLPGGGKNIDIHNTIICFPWI